jgi:nitroimidazol reductase NimA-like FMN-containing flavoprotein (pyridoxamine 5'-phosphate oxidase superfamily)
VDTDAARSLIDANSYMTLATADAGGAPWASPVWFAHEQYKSFLWISQPEARHSRNIAARAEIAIVIFDSTVSPRQRNAVYIEAIADIVPDSELADAVEAYASRSVARGLETLKREEVSGDAPWRLYRARASAVYVLEDEHDRRVEVHLTGVPVSEP